MENGTLFTSGFAGAQFNWWIGQIADDATWRDNSPAGKHESASQVPGHSRRYKVRIIGYHDQQEETIPSDQLPWAQVMYPITAGGGQASAYQTPALRQGNFVFGFFMDGQDMQVPVIMGVLGNNAQTALKTTTGTTESNFGPTSGFAESSKGQTDPNRTAPDADLVINKPKSPAQAADTDPAPPGLKLNKYGLRPDKIPTKEQRADQQRAIAEADARGLTGQERGDYITKAVADGIAARKAEAESPSAPSQPGATKENADAVHQQAVSDVKKHERQIRKIPLADPYDSVTSSLKNIQIILDNLVKDISKILETARAYVDAASNVLNSINNIINSACAKLAKYMKPVMDKVLEFIIKQVQKAMAPACNIMFPNMRNTMSDLKEQVTQLITCLFEKIVAKLQEQICSALMKGLGLAGLGGSGSGSGGSGGSGGVGDFLEKLDTNTLTPEDSVPVVPICYVETLTGDVLAANKKDITESVDSVIENVGEFLEGISKQLELAQSGITAASGAIPSIDGIAGNMASALSFQNIKLSVFGCDLKPKVSLSDFYTFASGSGGQEEAELPNTNEVAETAAANDVAIEETPPKPYAVPQRDQGDIDLDSPITPAERDAVRQGNIIDEQGNTIGTISSGGSTANRGDPRSIEERTEARLAAARERAAAEERLNPGPTAQQRDRRIDAIARNRGISRQEAETAYEERQAQIRRQTG